MKLAILIFSLFYCANSTRNGWRKEGEEHLKDYKCYLQGNSSLSWLAFLGDSNSDAGNARYAELSFLKYSLRNSYIPLPDPTYYYGSRFADGPVFGDTLFDLDEFGQHWYAIGFATACTSNSYNSQKTIPNNTYPPVPSAQQQAEKYIKDLKDQFLVIPGRRAVAIWAGSNDVGSAILSQNLFAPGGNQSVIQSIVNCTRSTVEYLVSKGECTVIVFNLPPEEELPYAQVNQPGLGLLRPVIQPVVEETNRQLAAEMKSLQNELFPARILYFDVYTPMKEAATGKWATALGPLDSNPCIVLNDFADLMKSPLPIVGEACQNPEKHVYYDPFHFSSVIQQNVIARSFIKFLVDNGLV